MKVSVVVMMCLLVLSMSVVLPRRRHTESCEACWEAEWVCDENDCAAEVDGQQWCTNWDNLDEDSWVACPEGKYDQLKAFDEAVEQAFEESYEGNCLACWNADTWYCGEEETSECAVEVDGAQWCTNWNGDEGDDWRECKEGEFDALKAQYLAWAEGEEEE